MDQRKKILLGNKDILSRKIQDFYLDINLSKDNKEIWPQKYDNSFDVKSFYDKERNESRDFIIYGLIESYSWDCDNLTIKVYQSNDYSQLSLLCQTTTKNIVSNGIPLKNIYGKLKGKYIIDNIPYFSGYSVYLKIETPDTIYKTDQQLIFTTLTLTNQGEKVIEKLPYGLNEVVTNCEGDINEINNDFDFFYNKHWVKKNIQVPDERTTWIPYDPSKFCETVQNVIFHGRNVYGIFRTGNFAYNTLSEVYTINEFPTGEYKPNAVSDPDYYAPVSSNGYCVTPPIFNYKVETVWKPADVNDVYTAQDNWPYHYVIEAFPENPSPNAYPFYDPEIMQTETVSGKNIYNSSVNTFWEFSHFQYPNEQQFSGDSFVVDNVNSDITIQGVYKEKCPLSIVVIPTFDNIENSIAFPPNPVYSTITYNHIGQSFVNKKTKFKIGELASVKISDQTTPDSYYIHDFSITGATILDEITQNQFSAITSINAVDKTIGDFVTYDYNITGSSISQLTSNELNAYNTSRIIFQTSSNTFVNFIYRRHNKVTINSQNSIEIPNNDIGQLHIKMNSPYIPSAQQSLEWEVDVVTESEKISNSYKDAYLNIEYTEEPPMTPKVSQIASQLITIGGGVWVDADGDGQNEFYSWDTPYPGKWKWQINYTGATMVANSSTGYAKEGVLVLKMTGDTILENIYIFEPFTV